jgi:competence protein ComFC
MPVLGRSTYRLIHWFWAAMDLLYPPKCGGCGIQGERWCQDCQKNVEEISPPICDCCGQPQHYRGLCSHCKNHPPSYTALRSWAAFSGPVRRALHRLKYQHDIGLGEILSRKLIGYLNALEWEIDLVSPVPLGHVRLKERGYNQAGLIARPLASGSGILYNDKAVFRIRETHSQVGLTATQRKINVDGAFRADPFQVAYQSILIVDDITTSGATIEACATALMEVGARQVYGLTLARTIQTYHEFSDLDLYAVRDDSISYQEE